MNKRIRRWWRRFRYQVRSIKPRARKPRRRVPILGYIVERDGYGPLGEAADSKGVLYFGSRVTLYPTRADARKAIIRTHAYAMDKGYHLGENSPWSKPCSIYAVIARPGQ